MTAPSFHSISRQKKEKVDIFHKTSYSFVLFLFVFLPKNENAGNFFQEESDKYNEGFCFSRNFNLMKNIPNI